MGNSIREWVSIKDYFIFAHLSGPDPQRWQPHTFGHVWSRIGAEVLHTSASNKIQTCLTYLNLIPAYGHTDTLHTLKRGTSTRFRIQLPSHRCAYHGVMQQTVANNLNANLGTEPQARTSGDGTI